MYTDSLFTSILMVYHRVGSYWTFRALWTVDILSNVPLIKNIREGDRCMNICGNAVVYWNNLIGDLVG